LRVNGAKEVSGRMHTASSAFAVEAVITNQSAIYMDLNPSSEFASSPAIQVFMNIFLYLKFHCRAHKSPTLVSVLSQINPIHINP
jgi:hypothetical protein